MAIPRNNDSLRSLLWKTSVFAVSVVSILGCSGRQGPFGQFAENSPLAMVEHLVLAGRGHHASAPIASSEPLPNSLKTDENNPTSNTALDFPKSSVPLFAGPPKVSRDIQLAGALEGRVEAKIARLPQIVPEPDGQEPDNQRPNSQGLAVGEHRTSLSAVVHRAEERMRHASRLAERGAVYSAQEEFIQVLAIMAQSFDNEFGGKKHRLALETGLTALEEADGFAPNGTLHGIRIDLPRLVASHRTPVLKDEDLSELTPLIAMQEYYAFAQDQLALAGGNEPIVSQVFYRLGRLQTVLVNRFDGHKTMGGPKAMVLYRAALMTDARNYAAANELGVLLARYGRPEEARRVLLHSVAISPQAETSYNLSVVHRTLGEEDAARQARAQHEHQLAMKEQRRKRRQASGTADRDYMVRWVNSETFAHMPHYDVGGGAAIVPKSSDSREGRVAAGRSTPATNEKDASKNRSKLQQFFWR